MSEAADRRFAEWIENVEQGYVGAIPGLLHCSLEHRSALRAAFESGYNLAKKKAELH